MCCCAARILRLRFPSNPESGEHNRASRDALCVYWPAVLRRICTSAFALGVAVNPLIALRRPHDAVGTRLAVCVRLCSCVRIRSTGVCVGVPAEKSQLSAGLRCCRSSCRTDRKISCSLGTTLSLSIRSCRQTPLRSFGCRSLIRPRFSSSRPQNPSLVHAHLAP